MLRLPVYTYTVDPDFPNSISTVGGVPFKCNVLIVENILCNLVIIIYQKDTDFNELASSKFVPRTHTSAAFVIY